MGWLKRILDRFRTRKLSPIPIPVDRYEIQFDTYLQELLEEINKQVVKGR